MNHIIELSSNIHQEHLEIPFAIPSAWSASHQTVVVHTGGTESLFLAAVDAGSIRLDAPIYLIASGHSNSLAASLEILAWVKQHGGSGRVITSPEGFALPDEEQHSPLRLGVVGKPSDWLIASGVDYDYILQKTGMQLVDIPIEKMQELGEVDGGLAGAEAVYRRLRELVDEYQLSGVTLRCFDLLTTVKNTGCMALSHLNDEGIPASCEGDIPLLLTMMLCKRVTGQPGFQVNPARILADGRMLFAHCTLPLTMTTSHVLTTHFESGIGVGIHGELPLGEYTLVKLSGDLKELLAEDVELTANQFEPDLCRTQVWIQATPRLATQMLTRPIANHHLLIRGHHANELKNFRK